MIRLVVLDMAGTTVQDDNAVNACFRAALEAVGVHPTLEAVNKVMGFPKPEAIRQLLTEANLPTPEEKVSAIHRDFVDRMRKFYRNDPSVREITGASAFFQQMRAQGIKVAINTGFSRDIADAILDRLGWRDKIDDSIASDEVPQGRPYPDMIRTLMGRLGIKDSSDVAKVGDTAVDLQEGENAQCRLNIGVTTGTFTRKQLLEYPHSHILDSLAEVNEVISAVNK